MKTNNVDIESMNSFAKLMESDPSKTRKTQVIEGEWLLQDNGPQFKSTVKYEGGQTIFEADNPTFMGGGGKLPGPMHYCFFGLAACYTGVFASIATDLGIVLKSLKTRVEADINFSKVFGLGEDPIMEEVRVTLITVSDAPEDDIREAERLALERCPVVFTMRNIIKLVPKLEITR